MVPVERRPSECMETRWSWRLVLLAAAVAVVTFTFNMLVRFFSVELTARITADDSATIPFPALTLCSPNQHRLSYVRENPELFYILGDMNPIVNQWVADQQLDLPARNNVDPSTTKQLLLNSKHMPTVLVATLRQQVIYNEENSTLENFCQPTLSDVGVCCTFNKHGGSDTLIDTPGGDIGLKVWIMADGWDYFFRSTVFEPQSEGFLLLVHSPEDVPMVEKFGVLASAQMETLIGIKITKIIRHSSGGCVDTESPAFQNPLHFYPSYTVSNCMFECLVNFVFNKCNCTYFYHPGDHPPCVTHDQVWCYYDAKAIFMNYKSQCGCAHPCLDQEYSVQYSGGRYPAQFFRDNYKYDRRMSAYNWSSEQFQNDLMKIKVFFQTMTVTTIQHVPIYTILDMWGDFGGYMGLCAGASILSLLEILEMCFRALRQKCRPKRDAQKTSDSQQQLAYISDSRTQTLPQSGWMLPLSGAGDRNDVLI